MSGIVTAEILLLDRWGGAVRRKIGLAVIFGAILFILGALAVPLGISKIRATPSWSLWSDGTSVLLFTLLHWACDVHGRTRWAAFARPAGTNALLTYLLPDVFACSVNLAWLPRLWSEGWPGVLRAVAFTALMLLLSAALTRARVRLQL